jgi:uncharacterized protein
MVPNPELPLPARGGFDPAMLSPGSPLVVAVRQSLPGLRALYVFGSQAQGLAGPDSDLDLAVLVDGYLDPLKAWDLSSDLAKWAGCPVDLVDLRAASTVMQHQVITTGRRLWADTLSAGLYESFVMSEKLALDEARRGLLEDIAKRGHVYGR